MQLQNEDTWTPPTDWCPEPHWWHSEDDIATEVEVTKLVAGFVTALQPNLVVETGTNSGQTAEAIGQALRDNNHGRLDTLEVDPELHEFASNRCSGLPVNCILGSSLDYEPPEPIAFAWLDSHIAIRHLEIMHLLPHLTRGAIIGIHDTGPQHPVMGYLEETRLVPTSNSKGRLSIINLHTPRGVIFAQVV